MSVAIAQANGSGTIGSGNITNVGMNGGTPSGHFLFVGTAANIAVHLIGTDGALTQIAAPEH